MSADLSGGTSARSGAESRSRAGRAIRTGLKSVGLALDWRGPDGTGLSVKAWGAILVAVVVLSRLLEPLVPMVVLLPPVLALAVAVPVARAVGVGLQSRMSEGPLRALEMSAVSLCFAAWGWVLWSHVLRGTVPIDTGDHQFMMGRAELIWNGMRRGKWLHWTHMWQGGDSLVDLYPVEANLLIGLFHALSPRGTPFVTSYSVFVVWTWWLRGVGAYYLSRRVSGPVVAFAIACASLLDVGADVWDGVWRAHLYWGMVHNTLALTLGLFAIALQMDLVRRVSGPRFAACAVLVALTACGHPLGMLVVVVQTAALGLAVVLGRGPRRNGLWALAASVAGLMLGGVWLLPSVNGLGQWAYHVGVPGLEYQDFGTGLFNGQYPTGNFVTFTGFGIVAVTAAVVSADTALAATAICCLLLIGLLLTPFMVESTVLDLLPSFLDGQPRRMLTILKTTSIPALAWLLGLAFSHLRRPMSLSWRRVAARAVVLGLLLYAPGRAIGTGLEAITQYLGEQVENHSSPVRRSYTNVNYDAVIAWLKNERAQDASTTPWRALIQLKEYAGGGDQWRHPFWAESLSIGVPFVDMVQISSNFLTFRPREFTLEGLNGWNIRFVITERTGVPLPGLVERFSAGPLHVYEVADFDDRYIVAPPGVTVGNIRIVDDDIRFDVSGAPPLGADLQIRTAWFPRWRARQVPGGALDVSARLPRPTAKAKQEQLLVHAGNGAVVVSCDAFMPRFWPGLVASLCSIGAIVFAASRSRRDRLEGWLAAAWRASSRWLQTTWTRRVRVSPRRVLAGPGVLLLLLLALGATARGGTRLALPALEGVGGVDVLAGSAADGALPPSKCAAEWWRGRYTCADQVATVDSWLGNVPVRDSTSEGGKLFPGTRVRMQRAGTLVRFRFSRLRLRGKALRFRVSSSGKFDVSAVVGSGSILHREYSGDSEEEIVLPDWVPYAASLDLTVTSKDSNSTFVWRGDLVSR